MRRLIAITAALAMAVLVSSCSFVNTAKDFVTGSGDVDGYAEHVETLDGSDRVRQQFLEAAATYDRVQVIFATLVKSPDIPSVVKSQIQLTDRTVMAALEDYYAFASSAPADVNGLQVHMAQAMAALNAANVLLTDLINPGRSAPGADQTRAPPWLSPSIGTYSAEASL